jgi:putative hydrolase of the HAD superfamily
MTDKILACCFDLGNTLNNDTLLVDRSVRDTGAWLEEQDHEVAASLFTETYHRVHRSIQKPYYSHTYGEEEFFEKTLKELGISSLAPSKVLEVYRAYIRKNTEVPEDVKAVMNMLSALGIKRALLSNERAARVEAYLETTGFGPLFDAVVVSERVGSEKPYPGIFREALRQLSVPPDRAGSVLMFGDNSIADGACTRLGMRFVLVHGYRTREWYFEKGSEFHPEFEIDQVTPELVKELIDSIG